MVVDLLRQCAAWGVSLAPGEKGALRVSPPGVLPDELKAALKRHKPEVLKLLTAPKLDVLAELPCQVCGSRERWWWIDGRHICRPCLVLDLAPLTLIRQGWHQDQRETFDHE
jgi:hypothetical protein